MKFPRSSPSSGNQGGGHLGTSFFVDFMYKKNVRKLCFHDFTWVSETNGMVPELFHKNVRESLYVGKMSATPPMVSGFVGNFEHHTTLDFLTCIKFRTRYKPNFLRL